MGKSATRSQKINTKDGKKLKKPSLEFTRLDVLMENIHRAGDERIELPLKVLETLVIPFDQSPIYINRLPQKQ